MVTVFLGAGFSALGGVPLASQLFNERPQADVISRENLIERVLNGWEYWNRRTGGTPEQYLSYLEKDTGRQWFDAVWYIALTVVLQMPRVSIKGVKPRVSHHTLHLTSGVSVHELFWTTIFRERTDIAVLTTNYDILAERGLRLTPRLTIPRPGFHYGSGSTELKGRGYPGVFRRDRPPNTRGSIPLLKLHGSVSWAIDKGSLEFYHDCRPAIRGDAAIIAPVIEKDISKSFSEIWSKAAYMLTLSEIWVIVGYSFPEYDMAINNLFWSNSSHKPRVHVLNLDPGVLTRVQTILPHCEAYYHEGLPNAIRELPSVLA